MRNSLQKILADMGFKTELKPYETHPWDYLNTQEDTDFSAEVALNGDGTVFGAEIQMIRNASGKNGGAEVTLVFWMRAMKERDGLFRITGMRVNGNHMEDRYLDWEEKGCKFFRKCIQAIRTGQIPDFKSLEKAIFKESDKSGSLFRGSGSRALKAKNIPRMKTGHI